MGRQSNLFKKKLRERAQDNSLIEAASTLASRRSINPVVQACSSSQLNLDRLDTNISSLIKEIIDADQVKKFSLSLIFGFCVLN